MDADAIAAIREKILDKLERVRAIHDRERAEEGWTQVGEDWIPPGWARS